MNRGLVAYGGDSDSEGDTVPDAKLKAKADGVVEARPQKKSQIIIKKPKTSHRPKGHVSIEPIQQQPSQPSIVPPTPSTSTAPAELPTALEPDEKRIRELLLPPPIPGLDDWGIPPEVTPEESVCDPALEAKLKQFHQLKSLPTPKHFNDTLMSNRSFRNPHLYAQLVEFVDVDERLTNFPKHIWDPDQLRDSEWDAEKIATYQKNRWEQQSKAPRTQIDFASSSGKEHRTHSQAQAHSTGNSRKSSRWG